VNADDFGLTHGINRGIVDAHTRGVVTSATLMAAGPARDAAVALSRHHSRLSVGCHIVLLDGTPTLKASEVDTLLDDRGANRPFFRHSLGGFAARAMAGRLDPEQVEAEATAQIRILQEQGTRITHFDTHKHTHVFPPILPPLLRAAKACGVRAVRNPFGPRLPMSLAALRGRPNLWKRFLEVRLLTAFASFFRRKVSQSGLRTPDGTFGVVSTGALDLALFEAILNSIPHGTWEFVCHPGYSDDELAAVRTRLRESRQRELEVLTSAAAREALLRHDIQLISYREL
jgi:predicted glycoside hydrolase/deacetylase ChbG (UPF0249 family)